MSSIFVVVVLLAAGMRVGAQQPTKIYRIGYLAGASLSAQRPKASFTIGGFVSSFVLVF